ncbi:helix-turn-helix transcriptional regulator [Tumebacillus sp. ITR2]|uniref:Helix-turn-helix transcriptional regulator n=1 Tax=Tumebacillus amylolyticus TaxID=2801339 RepID=A0ABS1JB93_9BACL|nr:helix-turn-helix transcriptional regulator [Tumebacillus amylolyticus]MBL0387541.1 helix-turn-helix transcriptional regulator [Tumebacillus amylolyticus]
MLSLGTRIREMRLKKSMTQIDLAKDLCTPSMISQIESDRARPSYKILFEIAKKLDVTLDKLLVNVDLDLEHMSTFKMAQTMMASKEYRAALPLLESVADHAGEGNIPQIDLLQALGTCQFHEGKLHASELNFQQAMELAQVEGHVDATVQSLLMLGHIAYEKRNLPVALHNWLHGLDELHRTDCPDPALEVELLTRIASAHFDSGKIQDAVEIYEDLVTRYCDSGHIREMAELHRRLGDSYRRLEQHSKAIHHLEQAITLYKTMRFQHSLLEVRRQHAILQGETGSLSAAMAVLEEVADEYEREGDEVAESTTLIALGKMALESFNYPLAEQVALRAQEMLPADQPETGDLHRLFATLHLANNRHTQGIESLRLAISSYRSHNRLHELEQATQELCDSLATTQSFEVAFKELLGTHSLILETLNHRGIVL